MQPRGSLSVLQVLQRLSSSSYWLVAGTCEKLIFSCLLVRSYGLDVFLTVAPDTGVLYLVLLVMYCSRTVQLYYRLLQPVVPITIPPLWRRDFHVNFHWHPCKPTNPPTVHKKKRTVVKFWSMWKLQIWFLNLADSACTGYLVTGYNGPHEACAKEITH